MDNNRRDNYTIYNQLIPLMLTLQFIADHSVVLKQNFKV